MTHAICPHCGYDLDRAEPVSAGPFHNDPNRGAFYRGEQLPLTRGQSIVFGALMRSKGVILSPLALAGAVGSEDTDDPAALIGVHVCNIRKALTAIGAPRPIQTVRGLGYRWDHTRDHVAQIGGHDHVASPVDAVAA